MFSCMFRRTFSSLHFLFLSLFSWIRSHSSAFLLCRMPTSSQQPAIWVFVPFWPFLIICKMWVLGETRRHSKMINATNIHDAWLVNIFTFSAHILWIIWYKHVIIIIIICIYPNWTMRIIIVNRNTYNNNIINMIILMNTVYTSFWLSLCFCIYNIVTHQHRKFPQANV